MPPIKTQRYPYPDEGENMSSHTLAKKLLELPNGVVGFSNTPGQVSYLVTITVRGREILICDPITLHGKLPLPVGEV